ncbi:MAG: superoxide dismutase family protein, partial [Thermoleophilaceae bacterium]|nr:superoxide dismutase family protein [Thermoleophilaceae bacterium]
GLAIVVHAQADDEKTDPTGNSGARIACGVIKVLPPPG